MKWLARFSALLLSLLAACGGSSSPTDPAASQAGGRLAGMVTIGPNCPGPVECPTPPSAYAQRKILVFDAQRTQLIATIDIDNQGVYAAGLIPATYVIDLKGVGADRTSDLPKTVDIHAHVTTTLNVNIDTGLR